MKRSAFFGGVSMFIHSNCNCKSFAFQAKSISFNPFIKYLTCLGVHWCVIFFGLHHFFSTVCYLEGRKAQTFPWRATFSPPFRGSASTLCCWRWFTTSVLMSWCCKQMITTAWFGLSTTCSDYRHTQSTMIASYNLTLPSMDTKCMYLCWSIPVTHFTWLGQAFLRKLYTHWHFKAPNLPHLLVFLIVGVAGFGLM